MALAFLCFELICTRFLRCLWQRSLIDLSIGQTLARRDRTEKIVIRATQALCQRFDCWETTPVGSDEQMASGSVQDTRESKKEWY